MRKLATVAALALGAVFPLAAMALPAGASSYLPGHQPGDAVGSGTDGGSGWVASGGTFPQWLVVDMGSIRSLSKVTQTFAALDTWSYKVEGSNDDVADDSYWTVLADHGSGVPGTTFTDAVSGKFRYVRIYVEGSALGNPASSASLAVSGLAAAQSSATVPTPVPAAAGTTTVGVQSCDLWANAVDWQTLVPYQPRISTMGYYDEAFDVATDWQIKMAVEHGISFVQPCWFRLAGNEGAPQVMASYDHFLNSLANTAKYRSLLKFDIDWINDGPGVGASSGPADFEGNLVPYWIASYFSKQNYLRYGGKPVLAIYDFEQFIAQMGGLAQARAAVASFRAQVSRAGYPGLVLLTQNSLSTTPANHWVEPGDPRGVSSEFGNLYTADYAHTNADAAAVGFDAVFAYHIPTFTDLMASPTPTDAQVLSEQAQAWANWLSYSALPTIVTASVGWNSAPWKENNDSWRLTPADWGTLLSEARSALAARAGRGTGSVLLLDNWNEYAEGHDIAPTAQDGYSYLDAVGAAFSPGWPARVPASVDTVPVRSAIPTVLDRNGKPD